MNFRRNLDFVKVFQNIHNPVKQQNKLFYIAYQVSCSAGKSRLTESWINTIVVNDLWYVCMYLKFYFS